MKKVTYILFMVTLAFTACQRQPTADFAFKNETNANIWVDGLKGLQFRLSCGFLGANQTATNVMVPVKELPQSCEITWTHYNENGRIEEDQTMTKSTINLSSMPNDLDGGMIIFHFSEPDKWTASFTEEEIQPVR